MGPSQSQCSTSAFHSSTLALKLFRGEPAISGFDWNFSSSHRSSANFSTVVGSVLHKVSPLLQPLEFLLQPQVIRQLFNGGRFGPPQSFTSASTCPWLDHPVSGLLLATYIRPVKTVRSSTKFHLCFNLPMARSPGFGSAPGSLYTPC